MLGNVDALLANTLECTFGWLHPLTTTLGGLTAQIRYRHAGSVVEHLQVEGCRGRVTFAEAQRAVCPGQTVVLYHGDLVVASGVIDGVSTP